MKAALLARVITFWSRAARLVLPAACAFVWAAVNFGRPAAILASPFWMRTSTLSALAQLKFLPTFGTEVAFAVPLAAAWVAVGADDAGEASATADAPNARTPAVTAIAELSKIFFNMILVPPRPFRLFRCVPTSS